MPTISSATSHFVQPAIQNDIAHQAEAPQMVDENTQEGWTPLHHAAHTGQTLFLAKIATADNINAKDALGRTPLHIAARDGHYVAVFQLLARGAEIDIPDNRGWRAAHYAAEAGHTDVIKVLFNHQANLDAESNNHTRPLDLAFRADRFETIQILSESGATISEPEDVFVGPQSHLRRPY